MVMKAVPTAFKPSSLYLLPVFLALYATAIVFRPPVPIDETRKQGAAGQVDGRRVGSGERGDLLLGEVEEMVIVLFWVSVFF